MMATIEEKKPEEEDLAILSIRVSFLKVTYVVQPDKEMESFGKKLTIMDINTLDKDKVKWDNKRIEPRNEDEVKVIYRLHIFVDKYKSH